MSKVIFDSETGPVEAPKRYRLEGLYEGGWDYIDEFDDVETAIVSARVVSRSATGTRTRIVDTQEDEDER